MSDITLSRGHVSVVDVADFQKISQYKWSYHALGYAFRGFGPKKSRGYQYLHRFILGDPSGIVDHINGDKLDNRRQNLRVVNKSINVHNSHKTWGGTKARGVYFDKARGKWVARVRINNQTHFLGRFGSCKLASAARAEYMQDRGLGQPGVEVRCS